jgi:signal transduction histidine kinase
LTGLTSAAAAVAAGDLRARLLTDVNDPDLGQLADSFNRTAAALERRVQADIRFAGDVSHELRTPLTTMLNSMALLQNRRADLPVGLTEPVDLLSDELNRFRRLVVDLLEISRDDSREAGTLEPVVIADLVQRAADAAGGPSATVEPDVAGLTLMVDKRRLERVVANLVENAQTHGGGCVAVRVRRSPIGVAIEVDDAGPGVPMSQRERVFERFARDRGGDGRAGVVGAGAADAGALGTGGVGLGLAIVARHVRWHRGEVSVCERPGGGARFVVELPRPGSG